MFCICICKVKETINIVFRTLHPLPRLLTRKEGRLLFSARNSYSRDSQHIWCHNKQDRNFYIKTISPHLSPTVMSLRHVLLFNWNIFTPRVLLCTKGIERILLRIINLYCVQPCVQPPAYVIIVKIQSRCDWNKQDSFELSN